MQSLSGSQVDRYRIQEEIGRGGMSRVYRAHHPGLERDVALKILLPEITGDEVSVARFMREARAAAQLDHPNIVPIYDTGQDNGSYFIAMRLIDGQTLRAVLGERELPLDEIGGYLTQIAAALDYAHERGIVHRDIKPENIMVDAQGSITLTDFGIANLADELSVTTTGAVIGTPVYMAPEQLRGELATSRADIYALGVLVYELVSGSTPFAGRAPYAVMLAQIDEQPQPAHERRGDLPPAASSVIHGALEKDPVLRYATAGEFASQFLDALGEQPEAPLAGVALAGSRLSGTGAVTIKSTVTPRPARVSAVPTVVASAVAPVSSDPPWRAPWFVSVLAIGLLLVVMVAGVSAFRDSRGSSAQEDTPALLPSDETATPENTPQTDVTVPVAAEPSLTTAAPVEVVDEPEPTVEPPPATEVPPVVVEEPEPESPVPADDPPVDDEGDDENPGGGPGNKPEKPERDKPDPANEDNDDEQKQDKDDKEKKEKEDDND